MQREEIREGAEKGVAMVASSKNASGGPGWAAARWLVVELALYGGVGDGAEVAGELGVGKGDDGVVVAVVAGAVDAPGVAEADHDGAGGGIGVGAEDGVDVG